MYSAAPTVAPRVGFFLAVLFTASLVNAQEFGGGRGEPLVNATRLGVESSWTSFDLGGTKGDFFGVTGRVDYRANRAVGLRLLVPVYSLRLPSLGRRTGLGDSELRLRVLVLNAGEWRAFVGMADQLPTGETHLGMGQGGSQFTPFVTAGWKRGPVLVYGNVADAIVVHPQSKPAPVDYVDPSTDHEARYTLGTLFEVLEDLYVNATVTAITVLLPSDLGDTFVSGGFLVGATPWDRWKFVASAQAPLAGTARFDVKLGLNAYFYF